MATKLKPKPTSEAVEKMIVFQRRLTWGPNPQQAVKEINKLFDKYDWTLKGFTNLGGITMIPKELEYLAKEARQYNTSDEWKSALARKPRIARQSALNMAGAVVLQYGFKGLRAFWKAAQNSNFKGLKGMIPKELVPLAKKYKFYRAFEKAATKSVLTQLPLGTKQRVFELNYPPYTRFTDKQLKSFWDSVQKRKFEGSGGSRIMGQRKRWVYGTRDKRWHLVGPEDRDFGTGISQEEMKRLGRKKAKEKYLRPSFLGLGGITMKNPKLKELLVIAALFAIPMFLSGGTFGQVSPEELEWEQYQARLLKHRQKVLAKREAGLKKVLVRRVARKVLAKRTIGQRTVGL